MASKCNACEARVLWCEIETRNGIKKIAIDPKPTANGDLELRPSHPDLPMIASKWSGRGPRFTSHRNTCPEVDEADRPNYNKRDDGPKPWEREPEGY